MLPTVYSGDTQIVDRWANMFHPPRHGDVIVFWAPPVALKLAYWSPDAKVYEKRVIGLPGDSLVITDTTVTLNGRLLDEPYVVYHGSLTPGRTWYLTVPAGDLFVMGDNRAVSFDSRSWDGCRKEMLLAVLMSIMAPCTKTVCTSLIVILP